MVEQVQDDFFGLSIGERLQKARKAKKKEIAQVADDLCINQNYIAHLEEDKFDKMPAAYVIGFLRSYSDYLSLDTDEIIAEVKGKSELVQDEHYKSILPQTEGKMPQKKTVMPIVAAVVVAVLTVTAILVSQKESSLEIKTEEVNVAEVKPAKEAEEKVVPKVEEKKEAPKVVKEVAKVEKQVKKQQKEVSESGIKLPPVEVVVEGPKFVNEKPHGARVLLTAVDKDVWFQIKNLKRNRVYVSRVLKAGEAYWVKSWRGVYIDAGLPQKLEVAIDGKSKGMIGAPGRRLRDLSLNPEFLTSMYFDKGLHLDKSKKLPQTKEQIAIYKQRAEEKALKAKEAAEKTEETAAVDVKKEEAVQ